MKSKVVWITGASSGIGEHLAYELAKAGCKLILSARRESILQDVKSTCLKGKNNLFTIFEIWWKYYTNFSIVSIYDLLKKINSIISNIFL